jgi:DNA-binding response OmpR family regulator
METPKGCLLVVEDVPDILALLETTLKFKGYRVLTAVNGQDALEQIQKEHPDLVVTDILMPRMDGFSLVHRMRIAPETRGLPVIFITATYVAPEDKAFALNIGATRFIEKPIVIEELLSMIEDLLSKPEPESAEPISEQDFYIGYRKRLETKLAEKDVQIARAQSLLQNVNESDRETFTISLHRTSSEREEILRLLGEVDARLEKLGGAETGGN